MYSRYSSVSMNCEQLISHKIDTIKLTLRHNCNIFLRRVKVVHCENPCNLCNWSRFSSAFFFVVVVTALSFEPKHTHTSTAKSNQQQIMQQKNLNRILTVCLLESNSFTITIRHAEHNNSFSVFTSSLLLLKHRGKYRPMPCRQTEKKRYSAVR